MILPITFFVMHEKMISTLISWHVVESSNPQQTKKNQSKQNFKTRGFVIHLN